MDLQFVGASRRLPHCGSFNYPSGVRAGRRGESLVQVQARRPVAGLDVATKARPHQEEQKSVLGARLQGSCRENQNIDNGARTSRGSG